MVEMKGKDIIRSVKEQWRLRAILSNLVISFSFAALYSTLLFKTGNSQVWWSIPLFLVAIYWLLSIYRSTSITENEVSRFLNSTYPELEESSGLVLKPSESLTFLEELQAKKVDGALLTIQRPSFNRMMRTPLLVFFLSLVICLVLIALPNLFRNSAAISHRTVGSNKPSSAIPALPPSISSAEVKIIPPAYTGKHTREQEDFNLQVEEGARVTWQVNTNIPVKQLRLVFNDDELLTFKPLNDKHTNWSTSSLLDRPGFYQVETDGKLSGFYKIEMIRDQPPVIHMLLPSPNTVIDPGEPAKVIMKVALSDDYGISSASVFATVASGSGEAVKFKEQQMPFAGFKSGGRQYQFQKVLDLSALGMAPGDELYYYTKAIDNRKQESRSDIYIISIPDTAQLLSLEGMTTGVNLVPEYFRSQRQIIIETEQLLKAKDTISIQQFNNKSNDLATDQKLLRLRYGKFLGEETDNEIGGDHDHDNEAHNDNSDIGNAARQIDAFTHKHDNAEDASFFEPAIKAQLKATLAEMWKAELQLRIYKPQQALPFEYKALRLLKDLQQKSRVYVAKTSFKSTPLKPEKRLTGDLSKIIQPVGHQNYEPGNGTVTALRKVVTYLQLLKTGKPLKPEEMEILGQAAGQLSRMAALQPAIYLSSLSAIERILDNADKPAKISAPDIALVEKALQQILPAMPQLPASQAGYPGANLSEQYFKNLNRQ